MDPVVAVAGGIAIGTLTGLLPGVHVNLIAALALTIPGLDGGIALGLVAVGLVHTFVTILPTTYLGAPDAEAALSILPAHRLLHDGVAPEAVRISLVASMWAAIAAVAAWGPYKWLLDRPGTMPLLSAMAPLVLLAVPGWLAWREPRRLAAFGVVALAAWVGWLGWTWPVRGTIPGAATPLLPMLSGLFGVPTLLWAIHQARPIPHQHDPPRHAPAHASSVGRGLGAAALTAVLPGLTAAVATAIAMPSERTGPRRVLATLSAVNTAHLVFALGVLWITGRTRSGLAIAWRTWERPLAWETMPPPDLVAVAVTVLVAGAAAVLATMALERPYERLLRRIGPGRPERVALLLVTILVVLTTGPWGLALFGAATLVGCVPLAAGLPRIHLAASLSVPIAIRLW